MNSDSFTIVIPTYNERDNIISLIKYIKSMYNDTDIIVVDDNSPDGTSSLIEGLLKNMKGIKLIKRLTERGRGSAVIAGFTEALKNNTDVIIEMDADFSHHPREIKSMIGALENSDMVIASRYLPGSRIIRWSWYRKFFSKLANLYARATLGIPITDYTNGFRAFKRETLLALDFGSINLSGYIVLSEVALQVFNRGLKIVEIPTIFVNRLRGESNLSVREVWSAFTGILQLWWNKRNLYARK